MSTSLTRFAECRYSVFISYAGADNETYGNWPIDFATVLNRQLEAALSPYRERLSKLPATHAFQVSSIVRGSLEKELRDRIAESFAMVIVVGEGYASSQWCLDELGYFRERFGDEGIDRRLFVVALDEAVMRRVVGRPQWLQSLRPDQSWQPFYGSGIDKPWVPVLRDDGKVPGTDFLRCLKPIREALVASIVDDLERPHEQPATPLLIGACAEELDAAVTAFAEDVRRRGGTASVLGRHHQHSEAAIKMAQRLVLPFRGTVPQPPTPAGELLVQQAALWRKFHKPQEQIYALDLGLASDGESASDAGLPVELNATVLQRWSPAALLDLLLPAPGACRSGGPPRRAPRARVWIESNATEPKHWKLLKRELEVRWARLLSEHKLEAADFPLFSGGMNLESVDDFPLDDADGLILLWGRRERRTLLSHINRVDDILRTPAPSSVAYLSPPNPHMDSTVPALGWEVLRFTQDPFEPPPRVVAPAPDDEARLTEFLGDVYARARDRFRPSNRHAGA